MAGRWTFVLVIALACAMVTAKPLEEKNAERNGGVFGVAGHIAAGRSEVPAGSGMIDAAFNQFDQNGGDLGVAGHIAAGRSEVPGSGIDAAFNQFDQNMDKTISQKEFWTYLMQQREFRTLWTYLMEGGLRLYQFSGHDTFGHDDTLDWFEFLLGSCNTDRAGHRARDIIQSLSDLFNEFDENPDKTISWTEFRTSFKNHAKDQYRVTGFGRAGSHFGPPVASRADVHYLVGQSVLIAFELVCHDLVAWRPDSFGRRLSEQTDVQV